MVLRRGNARHVKPVILVFIGQGGAIMMNGEFLMTHFVLYVRQESTQMLHEMISAVIHALKGPTVWQGQQFVQPVHLEPTNLT